MSKRAAGLLQLARHRHLVPPGTKLKARHRLTERAAPIERAARLGRAQGEL
ncbi:MAG: hypothetical protein RLZZ450_5862, partial [Pseudomonadota bacterium]